MIGFTKTAFQWVLLCWVACFLAKGQAPGLTPANYSQPQGADFTPRYQAIDVLTTTGETLTIQQVAVANAQHAVIFEHVWVYCAVACNFKVAQNGTAATSTAGAIQKLNQSPPSTVTSWTASNVGTGAFISAAYQVAAGGTASIDLSKFYLSQNGGTATNLSIIEAGSSGAVEITVQWVEK